MKYKQGKIADAYNKEGNVRVVLNKFNRGYRITLYKKKVNGWVSSKQREEKYKKYAERRMMELLQEVENQEDSEEIA